MTYALLTDVSVRLGRTISDADGIAQINAWIADAERIILRRIPDIATRIADGRITSDDVVAIEAQAVLRKVKNPDGYTYESIDDYRHGLNDAMSKGEIFITDDDWEILLYDPALAASPTGAFSTRPYFESDSVDPSTLGWP